MKEAIRGLNWRKLIMVSVLLGGIFSAFDITGSFTQTAFMQSYGSTDSTARCPDVKDYLGNVTCQSGGCSTVSTGGTCIYFPRVSTYVCPNKSC